MRNLSYALPSIYQLEFFYSNADSYILKFLPSKSEYNQKKFSRENLYVQYYK